MLAGKPEAAHGHVCAAYRHAECFGRRLMLVEVHRLHALALHALEASTSDREGVLRGALDVAR